MRPKHVVTLSWNSHPSIPYLYGRFLPRESRGRDFVNPSWTSPRVRTTPGSKGRQPARRAPGTDRRRSDPIAGTGSAHSGHRRRRIARAHQLANAEPASQWNWHGRRGWWRRRRRRNHQQRQPRKIHLPEIDGSKHVRTKTRIDTSQRSTVCETDRSLCIGTPASA